MFNAALILRRAIQSLQPITPFPAEPADLSQEKIDVHRACKWWRQKLSNAWQRGKLVLYKGGVPYKSMLGVKSLTWRSSLFFRKEVRTVLTTPSQLRASHFKSYRGSDKCGAVFRSIDDLPACFCMGRYLCFEPILPVATPVAGLWRSTCNLKCKPYVPSELYNFLSWITTGKVQDMALCLNKRVELDNCFLLMFFLDVLFNFLSFICVTEFS